MKPTVQIKTAVSKKGIQYKFIQVNIGDYEGRLYPTKGEIAYMELLAEKSKAETVTSTEG